MFGIAANALAGARRSFYDRIDCLEMAGICRKADFDFAGGKFAHGAIAEVIHHVAIAGGKSRDVIFSELGENDVERSPEETRQHTEPATMGHAHADFLDAVAGGSVQKSIKVC